MWNMANTNCSTPRNLSHNWIRCVGPGVMSHVGHLRLFIINKNRLRIPIKQLLSLRKKLKKFFWSDPIKQLKGGENDFEAPWTIALFFFSGSRSLCVKCFSREEEPSLKLLSSREIIMGIFFSLFFLFRIFKFLNAKCIFGGLFLFILYIYI